MKCQICGDDYYLFGDNAGIDDCVYEEEDDEDIYEDIHEWIDEHLEREVKIKVDGRVLK